MCHTTYFIDDDWKLNKRILNFCPIANKKGLIIGKIVERCLLEWKIYKIFTIIVDNASSNNMRINYFKQKLKRWNGSVLNDDYLYMRCCVHILSLIIKEGLKDIDDSIFRIHSTMRYARSFLMRLKRFKNCTE